MKMVLSRKVQTIHLTILALAALGAVVQLFTKPYYTLFQLGFLGLVIYWCNYPPAWLIRLVSVGPVVYRKQPTKKVSANKKKRKFRVIDGNK